MYLRLKIFKDKIWHKGVLRNMFRFAVLDYSRSSTYPSNFICNLPATPKGKNNFCKVFIEKSLQYAESLLKEALEQEHDSDVRDEIEKRLDFFKT
jgi:hypothetical protein